MRDGQYSRRDFLTTTATAACSALLPRLASATPFQDPTVDSVKGNGKAIAREKVARKVRPFPMKQVRLGDGPCKAAMEADRRYLHSLPPDRCCIRFESTPESRRPLSRWEDGRRRIANFAATTPAGIIFRRVR